MSEFPDRETLIQPVVFSFVCLLTQKIAAVLNLSLRFTLNRSHIIHLLLFPTAGRNITYYILHNK